MAAGWDQLDPRFAPYARWIYAVASAYGLQPTVTSVRRSPHRQAQLYKQLGGVQVCAPGTSQHETGLAFDMVVAQGKGSAAQAWLGAVWQWLGLPWSPNDPVHFSTSGGCVRNG